MTVYEGTGAYTPDDALENPTIPGQAAHLLVYDEDAGTWVRARGTVDGLTIDGPINVTVGEVEVKNDTGSPIPISSSTLATESTLGYRFSGGKTAVCTTVTASGDTTVVTASPSQTITLFWVSAINDPDEATAPLIKVSLGATELYRGYAIAHWERFVGAAGDDLVVNLSGAASVAFTAHYTIA